MNNCMNTVSDFGNIREAVCISAQKIMDACRDQECYEDIPVYLTKESQCILENATSVQARCAELLYSMVTVTPANYRDGYYTVDILNYYRVIADAVIGVVRPAAIYGLAVTRKCVTLYGGEDGAKQFSTCGSSCNQPTAVVEAIDPVALRAKINEKYCDKQSEVRFLEPGLPGAVAGAFDDDLVFGGANRRLTVTLGQFSIIRIQRDTQLLIPSYNYCLPEKKCCDGGGCIEESPCEVFARMSFPVRAFFPEGDADQVCECEKKDRGSEGRGCGCEKRNGCDEERDCDRENSIPGAAAAAAGIGSREGEPHERQEEDPELRTIPVQGTNRGRNRGTT